LGQKNNTFLNIYKTYQKLLTIEGLLDYEDLIAKMVLLLQNDLAAKKKYQQKHTHIFVDEFQDINYGQYQLIRELSPPGVANHHLCVIGDPDQAIYGFRGSDIRYFKRLITDYPDAVVNYLTQNYRSTRTILDASHQVIQDHSKDALKTQIYSEKDGKRRIQIIQCRSGKAEAETVGKLIEEMIGGTGYFSVDAGRVVDHNAITAKSFSDFAVLYRTADQGRLAEEVIEGFGIPCQRASKERVFHKKGAAELISMLKIICGVGSFMDLERSADLITPDVGRSAIERFKQWSWQNDRNIKSAMDHALRMPIQTVSLEQQRKLSDFIKKLSKLDHAMSRMLVEEKLQFLLDQTRLPSIIEKSPEAGDAVRFCISASRSFGKNTHAFLNAVALQVDTDIYDARAEKVSLMTMHAAKGLEFPVVFIIGCENGYAPYEKSLGDALNMEEERRLFYVAMTRAKEELFFLWAENRKIFGKTIHREVSPFVLDIEETLLSRITPQKKEKTLKEHYKQLDLFQQ
jgi:superfamily I DNA/RNA helicase